LNRARSRVACAVAAASRHAVPAHGVQCHRWADGEGARAGERARRGAERALRRDRRRRALSSLCADRRAQRPARGARGGGRRYRRDGRRARAHARDQALLCRAVRQERSRLRLRPARRAAGDGPRARAVEHALSRGDVAALGADHAQSRPRHRRRSEGQPQGQGAMSPVFGIPANVVYATAGIYAVLVLASIVVWVMRRRNPGERYAELAARTESWWWMIGAFTLCILFNQTIAMVFLAFISYLALKQYLSLSPTRRIDRAVLLFAYLAIPIQFYWAAIDWYGMFIVFVPVWMF